MVMRRNCVKSRNIHFRNAIKTIFLSEHLETWYIHALFEDHSFTYIPVFEKFEISGCFQNEDFCVIFFNILKIL